MCSDFPRSTHERLFIASAESFDRDAMKLACRGCGAMAVGPRARAASTTSAAAPLVHSDLAYRALLRNLALLAGMRNGKSSFDVLVTGVGASAVAARLRRLEPAVRTDVVGGDIAADFGARGFVSITPP